MPTQPKLINRFKDGKAPRFMRRCKKCGQYRQHYLQNDGSYKPGKDHLEVCNGRTKT